MAKEVQEEWEYVKDDVRLPKVHRMREKVRSERRLIRGGKRYEFRQVKKSKKRLAKDLEMAPSPFTSFWVKNKVGPLALFATIGIL